MGGASGVLGKRWEKGYRARHGEWAGFMNLAWKAAHDFGDEKEAAFWHAAAEYAMAENPRRLAALRKAAREYGITPPRQRRRKRAPAC